MLSQYTIPTKAEEGESAVLQRIIASCRKSNRGI
jgi:hypothetical protein